MLISRVESGVNREKGSAVKPYADVHIFCNVFFSGQSNAKEESVSSNDSNEDDGTQLIILGIQKNFCSQTGSSIG